MGTKKFTLIELHVDGNPQFGPKRIGEAVLGSGGDELEDVEEKRAEETESAGGPGKPIAALVGLVALVGVAVAVKKVRGGGDEDEEFEAAEEPDVVVN